MSSWGASAKTPLKKKPDGYFFQPSNPDICSLLNEYFEKCLFVKQKNKTLYLQENSLESGFKLIQNIFMRPEFVEYVDMPNPYYTSFDKTVINVTGDLEFQRNFATNLFVLRNDMRNTIQVLHEGLPDKFDVGVYIDSTKSLPIDNYISLLHKLTKGIPLQIFIMSNNPKAIKEFQDAIVRYQLPWNLYHTGEGKQTLSKKVQAIELLSEIEIMKHARIVICGASTSMGKFLYRICDHVDNFLGIEPL
jgi:hypothetical protein